MTTHDNPMGTDGFAFVEFSSQEPDKLGNLFTSMGFNPMAKHRQRSVTLYQQNNILFILNTEPNSFANSFTKAHGPCACGMGFRVKDAKAAHQRAIAQGAKNYDGNRDHLNADIPVIYGIGDSLLYFIEDNSIEKIINESFEQISSPDNSVGLLSIDHLTHNVHQGNMDVWADYYKKLFNFRQIRFFDIQGKQTGLISRAMTSPCNKIRIPLNESKDDKSQIAEYLKEYQGEGIQHIAMDTHDIYQTVEQMRANGVDFMDTPDTYFELIEKRLPGHNEDVARMQKNKILIDGGEAQGGGLLLQIFTNTVIGPIFFEIIQRKGNEGFGEGNFQALFDSIELDQVRRGVL